MQWFIDAAEPFQGMEIGGVGNHHHARIRSQRAGAAFTAITGIQVTHDLIGEGDVVERLQTQMQTGENIYDAYVNDSDLIGTHWRYQQVRNLTDWMAGEGARRHQAQRSTSTISSASVHHRSRRQALSAADQQFANLYWFRYDWFTDEKNMADFEAEYGYPLGVPVNWSAYEDIAEFFTGRDLSHMGRGRRLWPHGLRQVAIHRSAGASPMRGCRWPAWATWASPTACRSMNGAFA
jgi:glycerol transport system substrate-binding protein